MKRTVNDPNALKKNRECPRMPIWLRMPICLILAFAMAGCQRAGIEGAGLKGAGIADTGIEGVYETRWMSGAPNPKGEVRGALIKPLGAAIIVFKSLDTGELVRGVSGHDGHFRIATKSGKYELCGNTGGALTFGNPSVKPGEPGVDIVGVVTVEANAFTKVTIYLDTGKD